MNHEDFKAELPIRLVTTPETTNSPSSSKIPDHVILVVHERLATALDAKVCECDLNFNEKKVLEEYSYYAVVRTSEPSIIADVLENEEEIDLQDIYGIPGVVPLSVFKKFHEIQSRQLNPVNFTAIAPTADGAPAPTGDGSLSRSIGTAITTSAGVITPKPPFNLDLLNKLMIDHKVDAVVQGDAKPIFRGRTHLNQMNQIDWDDTPTIYQAASIAHGHLLHFKQEWIADGYSLGDLVVPVASSARAEKTNRRPRLGKARKRGEHTGP